MNMGEDSLARLPKAWTPGPFIGLAKFTFNTFPFNSFWSMLSIASCASIGVPKVTNANPRCFAFCGGGFAVFEPACKWISDLGQKEQGSKLHLHFYFAAGLEILLLLVWGSVRPLCLLQAGSVNGSNRMSTANARIYTNIPKVEKISISICSFTSSGKFPM